MLGDNNTTWRSEKVIKGVSLSYQCCIVPTCKNTTIKAPNKLFFKVPNRLETRNLWLTTVGRKAGELLPNSSVHCCEDHFDLPNDVENWVKLNIMGARVRKKLKKNVLPRQFPPNTDLTTNPVKIPYFKRQQCQTNVIREASPSTSLIRVVNQEYLFGTPRISTAETKTSYQVINASADVEKKTTYHYSISNNADSHGINSITIVKSEPHDADYESKLNNIHEDVINVKEEILNQFNNTPDSHQEYHDIDIKEELQNNLLGKNCTDYSKSPQKGAHDRLLHKTSFSNSSELKIPCVNNSETSDMSRTVHSSSNKQESAIIETYNCTLCGQSCPNQYNLTVHMLLHTNKRYYCDVCNQTFYNKHRLSKHKRGHQ